MNKFENETLEFDGDGVVIEKIPASETDSFSEEANEHAILPTSEVARQTESKGKRVKRTEAQMIQALGGSALKEAIYVLDRVRNLEEKIAELMAAIGPKGRERVIEEAPHLSRYLP